MITTRYLLLIGIALGLSLAKVSAQTPTYRLANVEITRAYTRGAFSGGSTQKSQIMSRLRLREGMTFQSITELDDATELWRESLDQLRILVPLTEVTYLLGPVDADGMIPVYLTIDITAGGNLSVAPAVRVNSNDGMSFGFRARHYNFLGSMEPLFWALSYSRDTAKRSSVENSLQFTQVLRIADHNYYLGIYNQAGFQTNMSPDFTFFAVALNFGSNWTFGSIERPIWNIGFNVGQSGYLLGEMVAKKNAEWGLVGGNMYDPYLLGSSASVSSWFNIIDSPAPWIKSGWLRYHASVGIDGQYRFMHPVKETRRGLNLNLNQALTYGGTSLLPSGFRAGYQLRIYNNNSINFYRLEQHGMMWDEAPANKSAYRMNLGADIIGFFPIQDRFAVNLRVGADYRPWQSEIGQYDVNDHWANYIRGIRNEAMRGNLLLYWNFELEAKVWMWRLDHLMDVHAVLFFDGGLMRSSKDRGEQWQEPFTGLGVEVKVWPKNSRNSGLRVSFGVNMNQALGLEMRGSFFELFIGSEMHF
jgi:hypothetical protein